ncbi:hypothetical protein HY501_03225 [Candidatus Woesearchaeota archaeon]|nr:hypothetical protein [Candidatus Woesearchaeota archaeon]
MKMRYFAGTLAALAIGGCGGHMDKRLLGYKMQDTGMVVPKLGASMSEESGSKGLMFHMARKYDTNKDGKADIAEIVIDDLSMLKSTERHLLVDSNKDGLADVVYSDIMRKDATPGVDGIFDMSTAAPFVATLVLGRAPAKDDLKLDTLTKLLIMASEE